MQRVESKNLFNCQLHGVVDDEVLENDMKKKQAYPSHLFQPGKFTCEEFARDFRNALNYAYGQMSQHPDLVKAAEECEHSQIEVTSPDGSDVIVPVLIHKPKYLLEKKASPAVIYAHGGGVVAGTADLMKTLLSKYAIECGTVYFNVEYRLAPETKCPNNALDFYRAAKYIIQHAADFGVDPQRIAIAGDSGGGYIVMATMVMLAQKDEGHLIKLAIPGIPMIDDYAFGDPKSMTKEEMEHALAIRKLWECIATDLDEQRKNSDPLLFPAKADDELLGKMPPTIIWEVEFDLVITEATRMAGRLRAAGRLLELYVLPGAMHGTSLEPNTKLFHKNIEDLKLAISTYL